MDGVATIASGGVIMYASILPSLTDALLHNSLKMVRGHAMGKGMKISPVAFSVENKEQTMYRLTAAELVRSAGIAQRDVK